MLLDIQEFVNRYTATMSCYLTTFFNRKVLIGLYCCIKIARLWKRGPQCGLAVINSSVLDCHRQPQSSTAALAPTSISLPSFLNTDFISAASFGAFGLSVVIKTRSLPVSSPHYQHINGAVASNSRHPTRITTLISSRQRAFADSQSNCYCSQYRI